MARIAPFRALLPSRGLEDKVSANTHVDDLRRQMEIVRDNPYTYLNVVKPYLKFNEEKDPAKHFPYAKSALSELMAMKAVYRDENESLYIYEQQSAHHTYTGLICTVPVEDYYSGRIRIHEKTITEKEEQLIMHIEKSGVIGEPVLLTHPESKRVTEALDRYKKDLEPFIDFKDELGRRHLLYRIDKWEDIAGISGVYAGAGDLYIADGHHRSAASAGYFHKHGMDGGHYLAYIVPPSQLNIDSFHRAYKAEGEYDAAAFLDGLKEDFEVSECQSSFLPEHEREFGLLTGACWYRLEYKHSIEGKNAVESLDVSILEEYVFRKHLHIADSKTDTRLSFLKGSMPCSELEAEVKAGIYDAVFTVHPCTIGQVFEVADQGLIMPPKSTYIEPKLRTGLTIQVV